MQRSHSLYIGQPTNTTAVKLLQTAAEFVDGEKQLAVRRDTTQSLLDKVMAGRYQVPDPLLLQAVDITRAHRQSLIQTATTRKFGLGGDSSL